VNEQVPIGASRTLFKLSKDDVRLAGFDAGFQVEPGGNRFLIARPVTDSAGSAARMILIQNWRVALDEKRGR